MQSDVIVRSEHAAASAEPAKLPLTSPLLALVDTEHAIFQIRDQWLVLEQTSKGNGVFQSFAWCVSALRNLKDTEQAKILVVSDQDRVVSILPLKLEQNKLLKELTGLAEPFQQYSEMLCNPAYDPAEILSFIAPCLKKVGADVIHLRQIRAGGALFDFATENFVCLGDDEGAPWLELGKWENFEEYLKSISARSRKTIRNQRNRLHKSAGLSHHVVRHGEPELEQLVLRTLKGREDWVEAMGLTSRALEDEAVHSFLTSMCRAEAEGCELIAMELKHGDVPISTEWGFLSGGSYSAYMADWSPDYEQYSPGKLHQMDVIEACFQLGVRKIDFLKPASRYKMTWTSDVAPVFDFVSPLSFKGKIYASLWLGKLRPLAKRMVLAMPKNMRSQLVGLVKRITG